jgi:hypothetical protein
MIILTSLLLKITMDIMMSTISSIMLASSGTPEKQHLFHKAGFENTDCFQSVSFFSYRSDTTRSWFKVQQ